MCGSGAVVCSLSLLIREAQACPLSGRNSTQRPVQILEAGSDVASEMRDSNGIGHGDAVLHQMPGGRQSDVHGTVSKSKIRGAVEKDEGGEPAIRNRERRRALLGSGRFGGHIESSAMITKRCRGRRRCTATITSAIRRHGAFLKP